MTSVDWSDTGVVARVRNELQADERALVQQHSVTHLPLAHNPTLPLAELKQSKKARCQVSTVHTSLEKCFQKSQFPRGTVSSEKPSVSQHPQHLVFKDSKGVVNWPASEVQKDVEQSRQFQKHGECCERICEKKPEMSQNLFCCRPFSYGFGPPRKETCSGTVLHTVANNQQESGARCLPVKRFSYLNPKPDLSRMVHVQRNFLDNIILLQSLVRRWLVRTQVKLECLHFIL